MKYLKHFEGKGNMQDDLTTAIIFEEKKFNKLLIDFLNCGYSLNYVDNNNFTPLTAAANYNRLYHMKKLLKEGADINYSDSEGYTPLMIAAQSDHIAIIEFLIKSDADWKIENKEGEDFIDYLSEDYFHRIIEDYTEKYEDYLNWKNANKYNL